MQQFILCLCQWSQVWTKNEEFEILVYLQNISCISPVHPRKAQECLQNRTYWLNPLRVSCMNACCPTSGSCTPWSPAMLSWEERLVGSIVFWKAAKISTGYAKYMTNQKRCTTVMPEIFYHKFVISMLYLVYTIPMPSIWRIRKDFLQLCQGYTQFVISRIYLV